MTNATNENAAFSWFFMTSFFLAPILSSAILDPQTQAEEVRPLTYNNDSWRSWGLSNFRRVVLANKAPLIDEGGHGRETQGDDLQVFVKRSMTRTVLKPQLVITFLLLALAYVMV